MRTALLIITIAILEHGKVLLQEEVAFCLALCFIVFAIMDIIDFFK